MEDINLIQKLNLFKKIVIYQNTKNKSKKNKSKKNKKIKIMMKIKNKLINLNYFFI